jgi:hypothetical protein
MAFADNAVADNEGSRIKTKQYDEPKVEAAPKILSKSEL